MRRLSKGCKGYQIMDAICAKYGSLPVAPDQAMRPLWDWLGSELVGDIEVEESDTPAVILAKKKAEGLNLRLDTITDLITLQWLFEYGYTTAELCRWTGIRNGLLCDRRKALKVVTRKPFKYLLKKGKKEYYVTGLAAACSVLNVSRCGTFAQSKALRRKGYHLYQLRECRYGDLPEGAVYITGKGAYRKGKNNSDYESVSADCVISRNR